MNKCVPFIRYTPDIAATIKWYEEIGFKYYETNHILGATRTNWAELNLEGATILYCIPGEYKVSAHVMPWSLLRWKQ